MERKIGERHRWVWMAAAETAVIAVELCRYNWISVAIGCATVMLLHRCLDQTVSEIGAAERISQIKGVGKVLLVVGMLWALVLLIWAANLAGKAFPAAGSSPLLGWILLGLAAWGSIKGADACAACCGVLCLFLLALYGVVAVFSLPDVNVEYLRPDGNPKDTIRCIGLLLPATVIWYLPGRTSEKKRNWDIAFFLPIGAVLLSAITGGVLSPELASKVRVPLYAVAQSVSLFGVVERIEPLLSAAMTMGIFAMLSLLGSVIKAMGNQIHPWKYYGVISCALAGALMYVIKEINAFWLAAGSGIVSILLHVGSVALGNRNNTH